MLGALMAWPSVTASPDPCGLKAVPACMRIPQDYKTNTGHGKLLLDDSLYPLAYATNVNEQARQLPLHALHGSPCDLVTADCLFIGSAS